MATTHPIDKVLVSRVVCGDDGEYVPVIFLHYVKHDRGLLLYRGSKLEEHGMVILQETKIHACMRTEESRRISYRYSSYWFSTVHTVCQRERREFACSIIFFLNQTQFFLYSSCLQPITKTK